MKGKTVSFYLPHDLIRRLQDLADDVEGYQSRSALIAALLYRALGYQGRADIIIRELKLPMDF